MLEVIIIFLGVLLGYAVGTILYKIVRKSCDLRKLEKITDRYNYVFELRDRCEDYYERELYRYELQDLTFERYCIMRKYDIRK